LTGPALRQLDGAGEESGHSKISPTRVSTVQGEPRRQLVKLGLVGGEGGSELGFVHWHGESALPSMLAGLYTAQVLGSNDFG